MQRLTFDKHLSISADFDQFSFVPWIHQMQCFIKRKVFDFLPFNSKCSTPFILVGLTGLTLFQSSENFFFQSTIAEILPHSLTKHETSFLHTPSKNNPSFVIFLIMGIYKYSIKGKFKKTNQKKTKQNEKVDQNLEIS